MKIIFDPEKRRQTLIHRGLDMVDAELVLSADNITFEDERNDYGEERYITIGLLANRMVYVAWTLRDGAHRIISMRKANDREQKKYGPRLDRSR
jgi:uncharacterized protein